VEALDQALQVGIDGRADAHHLEEHVIDQKGD
jgi:hypothetical protein